MARNGQNIYYVNFADGSDDNPGTVDQPKKTLRDACVTSFDDLGTPNALANPVLIQIVGGGVSKEQGIPWRPGMSIASTGTEGGDLAEVVLKDNATEDLFIMPQLIRENTDLLTHASLKNLLIRGNKANNNISVVSFPDNSTIVIEQSPISTTLDGSIGSTDTEILVNDDTGFPHAWVDGNDKQHFPDFVIRIDDEQILVRHTDGTTWGDDSGNVDYQASRECVRGYNGTTATSHSNSATVQYEWVGDRNLQDGEFIALWDTSATVDRTNEGVYKLTGSPSIDANNDTVLNLDTSFRSLPSTTLNNEVVGFRDCVQAYNGDVQTGLAWCEVKSASRFGLYAEGNVDGFRLQSVDFEENNGGGWYWKYDQGIVSSFAHFGGAYRNNGDANIIVENFNTAGFHGQQQAKNLVLSGVSFDNAPDADLQTRTANILVLDEEGSTLGISLNGVAATSDYDSSDTSTKIPFIEERSLTGGGDGNVYAYQQVGCDYQQNPAFTSSITSETSDDDRQWDDSWSPSNRPMDRIVSAAYGPGVGYAYGALIADGSGDTFSIGGGVGWVKIDGWTATGEVSRNVTVDLANDKITVDECTGIYRLTYNITITPPDSSDNKMDVVSVELFVGGVSVSESRNIQEFEKDKDPTFNVSGEVVLRLNDLPKDIELYAQSSDGSTTPYTLERGQLIVQQIRGTGQ